MLLGLRAQLYRSIKGPTGPFLKGQEAVSRNAVSFITSYLLTGFLYLLRFQLSLALLYWAWRPNTCYQIGFLITFYQV